MKLSSTRRARPTLKMRRFHLAFVLPAAALLLTLAIQPLHAQDNDDGLLRRGPHGQRPQMNQQSSTSQPAMPQPTPQPSSLPTTQPTTLPAPAAAAATDLHQPPTTRARVIYTDSQLEVRADNSSLLQILHDISRETRMAITGGVADQRIFGDYGPGSPATVLATLLDGTGTNMLLQQDPVTGAPIELVLSQRAGAAPPSSPNGPGFDDSPFTDEVPPPHPSQPAPANALSQPQPPDPNAPHPTDYVPGSPFNAPDPPPAATLTTVTDVPAVTAPASTAKPSTSTPESIYQQLLQMQQSKAKAAQPTKPPDSATPAPASSTTAPKQ